MQNMHGGGGGGGGGGGYPMLITTFCMLYLHQCANKGVTMPCNHSPPWCHRKFGTPENLAPLQENCRISGTPCQNS